MQIIRESRLLLCVGVCFACAYFLPSASTRERYRQYRHNQELRHEIERLRLEAEIECSKSRKKLDHNPIFTTFFVALAVVLYIAVKEINNSIRGLLCLVKYMTMPSTR